MAPEQPSDDLDRTARRRALRFAVLALALPLLAACKAGSQSGTGQSGAGQSGGGQGGSGLDTLRQVRERNPHYGR